MHSSSCLLLSLFVFAPGLLPAAENPLAHAKPGQWAKYLISREVPSEPALSSKNTPHWRVVADHDPDTGFIRVDNYILFGGQRQSGGPGGYYDKKPFEPVEGLMADAKITEISSEPATVVVAGKPVACTKIVRQIESPLGEVTRSWKGTSVVWFSAAVPLGLVRMENKFDQQFSADDPPQRVVETWALDEYGSEWKED